MFYCSLFNDIHIAKWRWRCVILWFFDLPSVEMPKVSLNFDQFDPFSESLLYKLEKKLRNSELGGGSDYEQSWYWPILCFSSPWGNFFSLWGRVWVWVSQYWGRILAKNCPYLPPTSPSFFGKKLTHLSQTACKMAYANLQDDTWLNWLAVSAKLGMVLGFTLANNAMSRHLEHPEIPYLDTSSLKSHKCIPGFHIPRSPS